MADRVQIRIDTHEHWAHVNPELAQGEPIYAVFPVTAAEAAIGKKPRFRQKVGTGIVGETRYNDLPFIESGLKGDDGRDAYQTIVAAGLFTGTIEEWYESLKHGPKGDTPVIGTNDNWWINGVDTGKSSKGSSGESPVIGPNNNWWINGADTGHSAKGLKGDPGDPIVISKHYSSDVAMRNDAINIPISSFVMITNANSSDPDNGKVFCRIENDFILVYQFSNLQAIKGDKGDKGDVGPAVKLRKYNAYVQVSENNGATWSNLFPLDDLKPTVAENLKVSTDPYNAIELRNNGIYVNFPQIPTTDDNGDPVTSIVKFYLSNLNQSWDSNFTYPTQQSENGAFMPARSSMLAGHIVKRVNFPDGLVSASDNMYVQISLNQTDWFSVPFTISGTTIAAFDGQYGIGIEAVDSRSMNFIIGKGPTSTKPWDFNFWWRICIERFMNVIVQYPSKGLITELNDVELQYNSTGVLARESDGMVRSKEGMLVPLVPEGLAGPAKPTLKAIDGKLTWDPETPDVYYNNIEGLLPNGTVVTAPTINGIATYMSVDHTVEPKRLRAYSNWERSNGYPFVSNQSYKAWMYSLFDETSSWCFPVWVNDYVGYYFTTPETIDQITLQFYDQIITDPHALPLRFEIQFSIDGINWTTDSVRTYSSRTYRIVLDLEQKRENVRAIRVMFTNFNTTRYAYAYIKYMRIGQVENRNIHFRGPYSTIVALNGISSPQLNDFADVSETSTEWRYVDGPNPIYIGQFANIAAFPITSIGDGYIGDNLSDGKEWYWHQSTSEWKTTNNLIGTTSHTSLGWYNSNQPIETTSHGTFKSVVSWAPFAVTPDWNYSKAPIIINYDVGYDDGGRRNVIKNYSDQVLQGDILNTATQYVYAEYNPATDDTTLLCQPNVLLESDTGSRIYDAGSICVYGNTIASTGCHLGYIAAGAFNGSTGSLSGDSWISANTVGSASATDPCTGVWIGQKNLLGKIYQIQFMNRDTNYNPYNIAVEISLDDVQWSTLLIWALTTYTASTWNTINLPDYNVAEDVPHSIRLRALDSGPLNNSWRINECYMRARRSYPKDQIIFNSRTQEYKDGYDNKYHLQYLGRITRSNQFEKNIGVAANYIVDSSSENSAVCLATYDEGLRWRTATKNTTSWFGIKNLQKAIRRIQWWTYSSDVYCVAQVTVEIQRNNNVAGTWESVGTFTVPKVASTTVTIEPNYTCDEPHCLRVRSSGANVDWIVFWAKFYEETIDDGNGQYHHHYQLHGQQCLSDYIETDWFAVGTSGTYTFFNSLGSSDVDVDLYWRGTDAAGYENTCTISTNYRTTDGASVRITRSNIYVYTGSTYTYCSNYTSSGGGYYKLIVKRRKNVKSNPL